MPQASRPDSSSSQPRSRKVTAAKATAGKSTAAKPTAAKATARKSAAAKPAAAKATARKSASRKPPEPKPSASRAVPRVTIHVNTEGTQAQVEAIAERLRKLNERIIELGREAGESTLSSYERALKTIVSGVSQTPAKDEFEWITQLAASQAKFVRDMTESWAKAARERLK